MQKIIAIMVYWCCFFVSAAQPNITRAEYFIDTDPGFGNATSISISENINIVNANFSVPLDALSVGIHALYIRSQNANGYWSVTNQQFFYKPNPSGSTASPNITKAEYFFDTDPGFGNGTDIQVTGTLNNVVNASFTADIAALSVGIHAIFIRSKDANNRWSVTNQQFFYKSGPLGSVTSPNITKAEYFFDTDPGFGNGVDLPIGAAGTNIAAIPAIIDISALPQGSNHRLFIRSKDANGNWSITNNFAFFKQTTTGLTNNTTAPPPVPTIAKVEYYIDADPGLGNATNYTIGSTTTALADVTINIDPATLTSGVHTFGIRSQDANGAWSMDNKWIFYKPYGVGGNINPPPVIPTLSKIEYYIDADPGFGNANNYPINSSTTSLADVLVNIDPATLTSGVHTFGIRSQDANGAWSMDNKWIFYKPYGVGGNINPPPVVPNLSKIEYYIDADPGLGKATNYAVTPATNLSDLTVDVDPTLLGSGVHTFGIRSQDANGAWSLDNKWIFFKPYGASGGNINPPPAIPNIVQVEYFIDTDSGFGNATPIAITQDTTLSNLIINANITGLPVGNHKIGVRAKDANGVWSLINKWDFVVPNLTVSPNTISYGLKAVNSSTTINVMLNNNGLPGQSISSVVLNPPFSTTYTPGSVPTTGTVIIPVTFAPTALLAYQDTVFINTTSGIFKVAVSGSAQAQNPQWSTNTLSYNYGNRPVGSSTTYNFLINNTGNIPLTVGTFTSTNSVFAVTMSSTAIPVGGYAYAQVTYNPSAIASFTGTIKLVNTSNTANTIFLQVFGTGYVQSTLPVISFPTSAPYSSTTGVNPAVGNAGIYTYSIKYTSATNLPPAAGYPKVGIDMNADGDFIDPGEGVYTMNKASATTNWNTGENFEFSTNLDLGSNYRYQFFANDSLGNIATSAKVSLNVGPLVTTQTLDLSIYANDITFSTLNPAVGQTFIVSAVVHNTSPYSASNVPIRFYKDSVYLTSGVIPYIAPNGTATITQPLNFSPDGFYPIKVWIDSANTLGEVQTLNNFAIRPIIVGNFSIPGEILLTSNATPYTCYNRVYISGTAVYSGLNLVGTPPVLGATVTVTVPGVGILTTTTVTGGFWSVYYNAYNTVPNMFNCATSYNYSVTVTDYKLTKTINPTPFSFPCVTCVAASVPKPYYYVLSNNTCPLDNLPFIQTFTFVNGNATSYNDVISVYADNVLKFQYTRDSIGLNTGATYNSIFTLPLGLRNLKYVHKYTNSISGTVYTTDSYNADVYVQPNLPDFSWYTQQFQVGPRSFAIALVNAPCVNIGANKVYLYDSTLGSGGYALIDSFTVQPIAANSSYAINYTRPSWVAGYHYLKLIADVNAEVAERDETNNIYLGLVYVPFPELSGVINSVSNPAIAGGTIVNFTGTIFNSGADAQSFKVQFLVDSVPLGNKVSIGSLAGNATQSVISPLYTTAADSCPHTITMVVDVDNDVTELNETNNNSTYVLGTDITQLPAGLNLIGQSLPFAFQKDVPGNFFGWVYNKGTRNAANVRMKFTYNGVVLGYDYVPELKAGQYLPTGNFNYTFTSAGLKTIRVDYDYPNELCEIDETNNVGYIYVYVNQSLPNLVTYSQYVSPSLLNPNPGQTVSVSATVLNTGAGSAAPSKLRFYYNDGPGYVQLGNDIQINLLLPGRDTTVAATATFAPGTVGLKIIKVGVDVNNEIVETSEIDNEATRSIIAGAAPDFARSLHEGITLNPNSFAAGDSITVRNYIRNYGGAAGTAWMRIYVKDSLHNIISVDSVLFSINGVDSALISKKMKMIVSKGYIVTEIVRSNPPEFNELNNTDSLMFTSVYVLPIAVTVPGNLDLRQANPNLFPNWIGGSLVLGASNLNVNGSIANGDSAHVIVTTGTGKLRIVNSNASNQFPIATSLSSRNFITITNVGSPDNFAVNVVDSVTSTSGKKMNTVFVNKTWNIEEDVIGGSNAKITVTWKASDELPGFNRSNCGIAHFQNGSWVTAHGGPAVDNGNGTFSRSDSGFTSFSPFSVSNPLIALPLEWLLVQGVLNAKNQAQLNWNVQEINVLRYEIEKSTNATDFNLIETINSKGDGNNRYQLIENTILQGTAFYRIKEIDKDGKFSYSTIIKLSNTSGKDLITIYPNPVRKVLFVNGIHKKSMIRLLSQDGKAVYTANAENQNLMIDMERFAAGVYVLEIINEQESQTHKVIKQ